MTVPEVLKSVPLGQQPLARWETYSGMVRYTISIGRDKTTVIFLDGRVLEIRGSCLDWLNCKWRAGSPAAPLLKSLWKCSAERTDSSGLSVRIYQLGDNCRLFVYFTKDMKLSRFTLDGG